MSILGISKSDNILLNSQNRETRMNRFSWETNPDDISNLEKNISWKGTFKNITNSEGLFF